MEKERNSIKDDINYLIVLREMINNGDINLEEMEFKDSEFYESFKKLCKAFDSTKGFDYDKVRNLFEKEYFDKKDSKEFCDDILDSNIFGDILKSDKSASLFSADANELNEQALEQISRIISKIEHKNSHDIIIPELRWEIDKFLCSNIYPFSTIKVEWDSNSKCDVYRAGNNKNNLEIFSRLIREIMNNCINASNHFTCEYTLNSQAYLVAKEQFIYETIRNTINSFIKKEKKIQDSKYQSAATQLYTLEYEDWFYALYGNDFNEIHNKISNLDYFYNNSFGSHINFDLYDAYLQISEGKYKNYKTVVDALHLSNETKDYMARYILKGEIPTEKRTYIRDEESISLQINDLSKTKRASEEELEKLGTVLQKSKYINNPEFLNRHIYRCLKKNNFIPDNYIGKYENYPAFIQDENDIEKQMLLADFVATFSQNFDTILNTICSEEQTQTLIKNYQLLVNNATKYKNSVLIWKKPKQEELIEAITKVIEHIHSRLIEIMQEEEDKHAKNIEKADSDIAETEISKKFNEFWHPFIEKIPDEKDKEILIKYLDSDNKEYPLEEIINYLRMTNKLNNANQSRKNYIINFETYVKLRKLFEARTSITDNLGSSSQR